MRSGRNLVLFGDLPGSRGGRRGYSSGGSGAETAAATAEPRVEQVAHRVAEHVQAVDHDGQTQAGPVGHHDPTPLRSLMDAGMPGIRRRSTGCPRTVQIYALGGGSRGNYTMTRYPAWIDGEQGACGLHRRRSAPPENDTYRSGPRAARSVHPGQSWPALRCQRRIAATDDQAFR